MASFTPTLCRKTPGSLRQHDLLYGVNGNFVVYYYDHIRPVERTPRNCYLTVYESVVNVKM